MLIDCGHCEFRAVACGDCLVTVLVESGSRNSGGRRESDRRRNNDVSNGDTRHKRADITAVPRRAGGAPGRANPPEDVPGRHAFGALELRGLSALAAAGLVPPLRYRPANTAADVIVALCSLAYGVIGESEATLAETVETAYCFH
jgi:hypothetical protein